jgi:integrase
LVCDAFERESSPRKLFDVTADRLSHFVARMRERGASEATIKSYLAQLKAMLNWGKRLGLLEKCPLMPQLPRAKASSGNSPVKGRPLVAEEFERMLAATAEVVGEAHAPIWQRYLRGLWVSGLRLEESLQLYWDRSDKLHPILPPPGQGRPHLRILAELEKGNQDRLLPISPDFALFLMETPPAKRRGPVFRLPHRTRKGCWLGSQQVGKTVSAIGKRAGVKVLEAAKTARVKFASAHDLRRSFGDRWARKLMPADLKEMMRHSSIETTLRYYVGRNADRTADLCWETTPAAEAAYAAHFGGSHNSSHNIDPFQRVA